jgi:ferritin
MISQTLQDLFNEQINKELYSSYLYLAMATWFEEKNFGGFAHWLRVQEAEERGHAMKLYSHVHDRGGRVVLKAISAPPSPWKTNIEVFKAVLAHEEEVTASINALYEAALKEKDYPAQILLQWFINEQVEEEKNATVIVQQLQLIEERGTAVYVLDHDLGKRAGE